MRLLIAGLVVRVQSGEQTAGRRRDGRAPPDGATNKPPSTESCRGPWSAVNGGAAERLTTTEDAAVRRPPPGAAGLCQRGPGRATSCPQSTASGTGVSEVRRSSISGG